VQCAGAATDERLVEGYFIPLGCWRDGEGIRLGALNEVFHDGDACRWGYQASSLPAERFRKLGALVEGVPYWRCFLGGHDDKRSIRLDGNRIDEMAEAWIPVNTPDGEGILVYKNCD
jgi:hypothetical protein